MKSFISGIKKELPRTTSLMFAVLAFLTVIYYILELSPSQFHSDCTDSLLWALASYESGEVFNPDFGYAAMLPFGASIWFVPLIAVFGVTMKTQLIGMAVFLVIFTASLVFMCRSFKWSLSRTGITVAVMLLVLSGSDKLREIMWGHVIYYSLSLVILFLILGLTARLSGYYESTLKSSRVKVIAATILLALLTVGAATDGFQVVGITVVPVIGAVILFALFNCKTKLLSYKNRKWFLLLIIFCASTFLGFIVLTMLKGDIDSGYTSAYSCYSDMADITENLLKIPEHLLTLLGASWNNGSALLDILSVMNAARITFALLMIICPGILFINYKKLTDNAKLVLWTHTIVAAVILYLCVFGRLAAANWRLTPIVGTGILVMLETGVLFFRGDNVSKRLAVLGTAFVLVFGFMNMYSTVSVSDAWQGEMTYYSMTQYLKENGLTNGYATFWNSNRLTVLSDSEVVLRTVSLTDEGIIPDMYQSDKKWFKKTSDGEKVCLVLTKSEYEELKTLDCWENELADKLTDTLVCKVSFIAGEALRPQYEIAAYRVLVFEENILTETDS